MATWSPVSTKIWRGRDDSLESTVARRLFQTIQIAHTFTPQYFRNQVALLGFECDEGVRLNKGRPGAKEAPDFIRKAMANLAAHLDHDKIVDLGNLEAAENGLEHAQSVLAEHIRQCHQWNMKTVVLGGGHETAYGHGLGVYHAYPNAKIGIINFDAHLDIRKTKQASSGTPFKQLADYCIEAQRPFNYMCVGANLSTNTQALLDVAQELDVQILWDTECQQANFPSVVERVNKFIDSVDIVYLTIDLDALPSNTMSAVSAPATLGVQFHFLLALAEEIKNSKKVRAVDFVEYNPSLDTQALCAKVAARFVWQMCLGWCTDYSE
ncbi:formimidoylglutamase [Neisseria sp. Ec49-e6-T10]|uniref:formimidoylglutamase n=1 Tax=Neisseria sp. Ec49-e6-T10 TaxID=3140744 RepID=UPI003EB75786